MVAPSGSLFSSHIECSRSGMVRAEARSGALPPARICSHQDAAPAIGFAPGLRLNLVVKHVVGWGRAQSGGRVRKFWRGLRQSHKFGSACLGIGGGRLDQEKARAWRDERQAKHRNGGHNGEHGDGVLE